MKNVDVEGPQPEGHPHDHELAPVPLGSTLEDLQTEDQRRILDTITQLRKCGLDGILSLPDIVVCGDQSAGKSSVLEALTEIPFPRNDNLCTRFATEISLRRELTESLTVRVIPDNDRSQEDQKRIKEFSESITDLKDLTFIMDAATKVMGINNGDSSDSQSEQAPGSAFSKDTLSIEINGPDRPQLTLIDIPGLIQSATKGVSEADVAMVTEITDRYIKRHRTICLAVVSATNDAANQPILQRVRKFDPQGERTLGVITKPDQLSSGSGSESKFLELACNKDVFFKLGWHVIRNHRFDENGFSFEERNAAEAEFFRTSNFSVLPKDMVGIEALRARLSFLLFEHVKAQLPQLREELERALQTDRDELNLLGDVRLTPAACRVYLTKLSMECQEICKAGLNGNYEHEHFKLGADEMFSLDNTSTISRLRAAIQYSNSKFAEQVRKRGHKYIFSSETDEEQPSEQHRQGDPTTSPKTLSQKDSLAWVRKMLLRSRGTELIGNFNPHLIGELFWEQAQPWETLASSHVEQISQLCTKFLANLLEQKVPKEIQGRIWSFMVEGSLKQRKQAAYDELAKLIRDIKDFPINYNHYYTDIIEQRRHERLKVRLEAFFAENSAHLSYEKSSFGHYNGKYSPEIAASKLISSCLKSNCTTTIDMDNFSGEEALDCLQAIYQVQYKTFVANVTTQVIERQMIRGLDKIFSPLVVISMADNDVNTITAERPATKRQRLFLTNRVQKLEEGRQIFQELISTQFVPEVSGS